MIGQYQILQKLGEGGMGAVYAAVDSLLGRKVALKSLRPELMEKPEIVARFLDEAKIQAKLNSPHIVQLYNFLREGQEFYMVMEFVDGRTLSQLIAERGRLEADQAAPLMLQALTGLSHAHKMGIVHRDIKPANIMVTGDGLVKVTDFGIARVLGNRRLTKVGSIVGTLEYISPEGIQGAETTAVSDVYSCGVVLYKMVTGLVPFNSENEFLLAKMHVESPPPPPRQYVPDLPQKMQDIILRALAKKPQDRFRSAEHMAQALQAWLDESGGGATAEASFWRWLTGPVKSTPGPISRGGYPGTGPSAASSGGYAPEEDARRVAVSTASRQIDELLGQHRWEDALEVLQRNLAVYPQDPLLLDLRNRVDRERQRYEEGSRRAQQEVRNLLERGLPGMAITAAEVSLERYHGDVGLQALLVEARRQVALQQERESHVTTVEQQIRPLVDQQRFDDAVAVILDAVAQHPNQPQLAALLSRTVQAKKDAERRRAMQAALQPLEELKQSGEFERALEGLRPLVAQYGTDPQLLALQREWEGLAEDTRRRAEIEGALAQEQKLESTGSYEEARLLLDNLLQKYPQEQRLLQRRMALQAEVDRRRKQRLVEAARRRAEELRLRLKWKDALDSLEHARAMVGDDPGLTEQRAIIKREWEIYQKQIRDALEQGRSLLAEGHAEDAFLALTGAANRFPEESRLREMLVEAQAQLEAQRRAERFQAFVAAAETAIAEERFSDATKGLREAGKEFPNDAQLTSLMNRALEAERARDRREAIAGALREADEAERAQAWERGLAAVREVLAKYPGEAELSARLASMEQAWAEQKRAERRKDAVKRARREAEQARNKQDWPAAMQALEPVAREYPEAEEIVRLLEQTRADLAVWERQWRLDKIVGALRGWIDEGRLDEAIPELAQARAEFGAEPVLTELGQEIERQVAEQLRQREIAAAAEQASIFTAQRRWNEAASVLTAAEKQHGPDERLHERRARLEEARQEYETAVSKAEKGARELMRAADWKQAVDLLQKACDRWGQPAALVSLRDEAEAGWAAKQRADRWAQFEKRIEDRLASGNLAAAEKALEEGLAEFGDEAGFAGLLERLGELQTQQRRDQAVTRVLNEVAALDRQWDAALERLAAALQEWPAEPRLEEAKARTEAARREYQQAVDEQLARTRRLLDEGQAEAAVGALEALTGALAAEPALAALRREARERWEAQKRAARITQLRSDAEALAAQGSPDTARARLVEALKQYPEEPGLREALARVEAQLAEKRAVEQRVAEIRKLIDAGQGAAAWQAWEKASGERPEAASLLALREAAAQARDEQARREALQQARQDAQRSFREGDWDGAELACEFALQEHGEDAALRDLLRQIAKRREEAAEQAKRNAVNAAQAEAKRMADRGQFAEAKARLEQTLAEYRVPELETLAAEIEARRAQHEAQKRKDAVAAAVAAVRFLIAGADFDGARERLKEARAQTDAAEFRPLENEIARKEKEHAEQQRRAAVDAALKEGRRLLAAHAFGEARAAVEAAGDAPELRALLAEVEQKRVAHEAELRRKAVEERIRGVRALLEKNEFEAARTQAEFALIEFDDAALRGLREEIDRREAEHLEQEQAARLNAKRSEVRARAAQADFAGARQLVKKAGAELDKATAQALMEEIKQAEQAHQKRAAEEAARARQEALGRRRAEFELRLAEADFAAARATAAEVAQEFDPALLAVWTADVERAEAAHAAALQQAEQRRQQEEQRARQQRVAGHVAEARRLLGQGDVESARLAVEVALLDDDVPELRAVLEEVSRAERELAEAKRRDALARTGREVDALIAAAKFDEARARLPQGGEEADELRALQERIAQAESAWREEQQRRKIQQQRDAAQQALQAGDFVRARQVAGEAQRESGLPEFQALLEQIERAERDQAERERRQALERLTAKVRGLMEAARFGEARAEWAQASPEPEYAGLNAEIDAREAAWTEQQRQERARTTRQVVERAWQRGAFEEAEKAIWQGLEADPDNPGIEALFAEHDEQKRIGQRRAELARRVDQIRQGLSPAGVEEAERQLRELEAEYAGEPLLGALQGEIAAQRTEARRREELAAALRQAESAMAAGDWSGAQAALRALPELSRREPDVAAAESRVQVELQRQQARQAELTRLTQLVDRRKFEEALRGLTEARTRYPEEPSWAALEQRAAHGAAEAKVAEILAALEKALKKKNVAEAERLIARGRAETAAAGHDWDQESARVAALRPAGREATQVIEPAREATQVITAGRESTQVIERERGSGSDERVEPGRGKGLLVGGGVAAVAVVGALVWMFSGGAKGYDVSPAKVSVSVTAGQSKAAALTLKTADKANSFAAAANREWVKLEPATGEGNGSVQVMVDAAELKPGAYDAEIEIKPKAGEAKRVPLSVKVEAPLVALVQLKFSESPVVVNFQTGQPFPAPRQIRVTASRPVAFTARVIAGDWLTVSSTGNAPGVMTVQFNIRGKNAGNYEGQIEVRAEGQRFVLPVRLQMRSL
jgi:serine/threonine-protein kinase